MERLNFFEEQMVRAVRQADSGTPIGDCYGQLGMTDATFFIGRKSTPTWLERTAAPSVWLSTHLGVATPRGLAGGSQARCWALPAEWFVAAHAGVEPETSRCSVGHLTPTEFVAQRQVIRAAEEVVSSN